MKGVGGINGEPARRKSELQCSAGGPVVGEYGCGSPVRLKFFLTNF